MFESLNVASVTAVAGSGLAGALIDLKTRRVPNPLTLGIAVTGLVFAATRLSGASATVRGAWDSSAFDSWKPPFS
jgi:prepilin signal peptidase PulO-like enzyme (type II secretory pathway)